MASKSKSNHQSTQEFHEALANEIPESDIIAAWKDALQAMRIHPVYDKGKNQVVKVESPDHVVRIRAARDLAEFLAGRPRQQVDIEVTTDEQTAFDRLMEKAMTDPNVAKSLRMSLAMLELRLKKMEAKEG